MDRPFGLLAELTYACPLHCPYCSNPLNLGDYSDELTAQEWQRVLAEARELGVLQLHLSGGEPLQRRDLVEIVRSAAGLGLYTNLITSGLGLTPRRAGHPSGADFTALVSTGSGFNNAGLWASADDVDVSTSRFVTTDLTGDGRTDLVVVTARRAGSPSGASYTVLTSGGSAFNSAAAWGFSDDVDIGALDD